MATATPQSTSTRTGSSGSPLIFMIPAGVVLAGFYLSRLPPGVFLRALRAKPDWLGFAALVLALPVLIAGTVDFLRARRRTYVPPSLRVRIARSLTYGTVFYAANVFLCLWFAPAILVGLQVDWGPTLLLLMTPVPLYAALAWYICFARRRFTNAALPSFREAARALADTNDFIIGKGSSDWKTGGGDPFWWVIPERGMFANVYCLGGIGSGKTSSVAKPLLEQAMFKFPRSPDKKIGIFLLDAKGNNADYVLERARKAGREQDVVILKPGGLWSYNPLAEGTPTALANKLVAALEAMTNQESNTYYKKMQREFAENAFQILSDVVGAGKFTMMDIYDFICDAKVQKKFLDAAKPKNSISYRWFVNQWQREDPREQMLLTKGFRADLSSFVRDEIAPTFAVANANFPGWLSLLDDGKIVVFSMSLDEYGDFARAMGIFVLMDFQNTMLARTTPKFQESKHNRDRLVLCFLDEVWAYINPKLAEFTSVSREARCCTIALHQSLGQIPPQYRDIVLGNFRTPCIFSINDILSLDTFSRLFGTHKVLRESTSESQSFAGVEHGLLTDAMAARAGGESRSVAISSTFSDEPRFSTDEILHLPKQKAIIQMYDGDNTRSPAVIETLPAYLPENQLA